MLIMNKEAAIMLTTIHKKIAQSTINLFRDRNVGSRHPAFVSFRKARGLYLARCRARVAR